jgi:predicted nucleic acid-binding protein
VKYALDTNIYIDAFRDPAVEAALLRFLERALPFTFLSAIVMQELAAGARTPAQARELERSVFQPFVRRRRVFAPMTTAFVRSGRLIAAVAAREGWPAVYENPSLFNDACGFLPRGRNHSGDARQRLRSVHAIHEGMASCPSVAGPDLTNGPGTVRRRRQRRAREPLARQRRGVRAAGRRILSGTTDHMAYIPHISAPFCDRISRSPGVTSELIPRR